MKKIITLFLVLSMPYLAFTQTLTPTVVASSGGYLTASNGSLSFTVGEMTMVQTFASANNYLTQGFQQPEDLFVSIAEQPITPGGLVTYPNPTTGTFSLQYNSNEESEKVIDLYNSMGQMVKRLTVHQSIGANKLDFDLSSFACGIYVIELKLRNVQGDLVPVTSKIILQQ